MLEKFWAMQNWQMLEKINGWKVTREGDRVTFELAAKDGEQYKLLLGCDNYPFEAPSVMFINSEGSRLDPKAWPRGAPSFMEIVKPPQECFLCMQLTREGLKHHPDWKTQAKAWNAERNTLLDLLNFLDRLLNSPDYQGRGG